MFCISTEDITAEYINIYIYVCVCIYICVCVCMCECMRVCEGMRVYVDMYVYACYVCIYVSIHFRIIIVLKYINHNCGIKIWN